MPTTINDELTRIENAKADIATAIGGKGVTVPANAKIDDFADLIDAIQMGGGGTDDTFEKVIKRTITSVDIPSGTTYIPDYFFSGCTSLSSVTFPSSLTTIYAMGFNYCSSLTTVDLRGTGLTTIGVTAFFLCVNLKDLYLPSSINTINSAFGGCNNLEKVVVLRELGVPSLAANTFNGTKIARGTGYIYVPYSSDHSVLNAYKTATNWSTYANQILELDENGNIPT